MDLNPGLLELSPQAGITKNPKVLFLCIFSIFAGRYTFMFCNVFFSLLTFILERTDRYELIHALYKFSTKELMVYTAERSIGVSFPTDIYVMSINSSRIEQLRETRIPKI